MNKLMRVVACLCCSIIIIMMGSNVNASCINESESCDVIIEATVVLNEETESDLINMKYTSADFVGGVVAGDGIALRTGPAISYTRLELMYNKEKVKVNLTKSYKECPGGSWYYLQRTKTGTWGWASIKYINAYD